MKAESVLLRRLWFGLLLLTLFFAPWLGGGFDGSGPPIARTLAAATVLFWMLDRRGAVLSPSAVTLWAAFVAWCLVTVTQSIHLHGSLTTLSDYVTWGGLALVTFDAGRDERRRFGVAAALLASLAVVGGFGVFDGLTNVAGWRVFGPFNTPNLYASYIVTLLPLALFASLRCPGTLLLEGSPSGARLATALLRALALLLGLTALLMTGSKGAVLAFAVALVLVAVLAKGARSAEKTSAALAVVFLAVAIIAGSGVLRGRVGAASASESHSGAFRRLTWDGTARMAAAHPVVGTGVGTFGANYSRRAVAGWTAAAHNSFLQTAAETGLPGVFLFTASLAAAAWGLFRRSRSDEPAVSLIAVGALAGLLAAAAHNLVDYGWAVWAPGAALWALAGLGLAGSKSSPWPRPAVWALGVLAAFVLVTSALMANAQTMAQSADAAPPSEAAQQFASARRLDPLDAKLAVTDGRLLRATGDLRAAETAFRDATRLNPGDATAWRNLAEVVAVDDGRLQESADLYRRGLDYSPNGLKLLAGLARTEAAMGQTDAARATWQRVTRVHDGPVGRYPAIPEVVEVEPIEAHAALAKLASDPVAASRHLQQVLTLAGEYDARRKAHPLQWKAVGRGSPEETAFVTTLRDEASAAASARPSP